MRTIRLRLVLPILLGLVSFALIAWEFHNEQVIQRMGMRWDTGPPVWPYQASWILLQGINAPAYVIDLPFFRAVRLQAGPPQLAVEFLTILLWWWFISWRIEAGFNPMQNTRQHKWHAVGLWIISLGLGCFLAFLVADQLRFWLEYRTVTGQLLRLMRYVGLMIWCLLLGAWTGIVGFRYFRRGHYAKTTC